MTNYKFLDYLKLACLSVGLTIVLFVTANGLMVMSFGPAQHRTLYKLTVVRGTINGGDSVGEFSAGIKVPLVAHPFPGADHVCDRFDIWTAVPDDVTIEDRHNMRATLIMPDVSVVVTARYLPQPPGGCR